MFKKSISLLGFLVSGLTFASEATVSKQPTIEDLRREIMEQCGPYTDSEEFQMCVSIVEMDLALVPQGCSGGSGSGGLPSSN